MNDLNPADLRLVSHSASDGVTTSEFVLGDVTAALWEPEHAEPGTPLVALGHGGGRFRHHPSMTGRARLLTDAGFRAVALDVDGHGPRPRGPEDEKVVAALHAARRAGEPIGPIVEPYNADLARRTVPEWRALLAGLLARPEIGDAPVGFWGITLGTAVGVPLVAEEPLIRAAVFGLFWPSTLLDAARRITVPIEFALQWDDEHIPREGGLALFDAFASTEKSLHVNAGKHMDMPRFEAAGAVRFFERHLCG
ncbi:dienelactone hydrolase family protein [Actinospica robiniae]|uniref:dienelactone hydrolase family protein n=1 Tax=Actinospica robiniae TaxID=304901 RepID=UPI0003FBAA86|nr:alpha/beta hydrolase [Actinospica robiniae]